MGGRKGEYLSIGPCIIEDIDVTFSLREKLGKRAGNEIWDIYSGVA